MKIRDIAFVNYSDIEMWESDWTQSSYSSDQIGFDHETNVHLLVFLSQSIKFSIYFVLTSADIDFSGLSEFCFFFGLGKFLERFSLNYRTVST